jgi:hypothetical protein
MMPIVPDRIVKLRVIRDLVYEYGNLMAAAHFDLKGSPPWRTNCDDAFILGCRKIGDFLLTEIDKRYMDDVLAMDYLPLNVPRTWDLPIWKARWREDMNKYLTHITYRRAEDRAAMGLPNWDHQVWVPPLRDEFKKAWWDFRDTVTDGDFCAEFDKQLDACQHKPGFEAVTLTRR